jgi:hypothetical protein
VQGNEYAPISTRLRLLKKTERAGVVSVPIVLYNHYVSKSAWDMLSSSGAQLSFDDDGCVQWRNPVLVGISPATVAFENSTVLGSMASLHRSYFWTASADIKGTRLVGPVKHRGNHFYALTVPDAVFDGVDVSNWNFLMGKRRVPPTV